AFLSLFLCRRCSTGFDRCASFSLAARYLARWNRASASSLTRRSLLRALTRCGLLATLLRSDFLRALTRSRWLGTLLGRSLLCALSRSGWFASFFRSSFLCRLACWGCLSFRARSFGLHGFRLGSGRFGFSSFRFGCGRCLRFFSTRSRTGTRGRWRRSFRLASLFALGGFASATLGDSFRFWYYIGGAPCLQHLLDHFGWASVRRGELFADCFFIRFG